MIETLDADGNFQVLDFGASRDGIPAPERGFRKELTSEESRVVEDEA